MSTNQNPPPSPPTFNDNAGRSWTIRLDFAAFKRIRSVAQVDLGNLAELSRVWAELMYDELKLLDVLWLLIEPAASASSVTRDSFEQSMDGVTLESARKALGVARENFSPSQKSVAAASIAAVEEGYLAAIGKATENITEALAEATEKALSAFGN